MTEADEELEKIEAQLKELEAIEKTGYGSPSQVSKEGLFKFFNRILDAEDSTKIANLSTTELGDMKLGVRAYQRIANYADVEGLDKVGIYLRGNAEIVSRTSMSKKGFWSKLFVTQIKKEQKVKEPTEQKTRWWSSKKEEDTNE